MSRKPFLGGVSKSEGGPVRLSGQNSQILLKPSETSRKPILGGGGDQNREGACHT